MMGAIQSAIEHDEKKCILGAHFCLSWVGLSSIEDRLKTLAMVVQNLAKQDEVASKILFASVSAVILHAANEKGITNHAN
jgi:hypothetical protein